MFSPVLAVWFGLDFYAFCVSHESFNKVSLLAACPLSAKSFVLPWMLRSSGKYPGITFLPCLEPAPGLSPGAGPGQGLGFEVWGLLPAQLIPGWILPAWSLGRGMGEFAQSHGLSSGLKWNLVLMGGRKGILALLAPGFPGKTQQKS